MKTFLAIIVGIIYFIQDLIIQLYNHTILFFLSFLLFFKTIAIAVVGGFVDYIIQKKKTNELFSFKKAFFHCFIAGFSGYLSIKLCEGFYINADLTGFLTGISGFAGTRSLNFFEELSHKILEKFVSTKDSLKEKHFKFKLEIEIENEKENE